MAQILSQPQGSDRPWYFTLYDSATGALIDDYSESDVLECTIWSGLDQVSLATPTATWVDVLAGKVQVLVAASDIADLQPGIYRMEAAVTHDGERLPFFDGSIDITPAPGAIAAPAVYCTFEDMKLYAPQVQNLQDTRTDLAGFLANRARARTWTNERCLDGYRPNYGRARRYVAADGLTAGPHLRWVATGPAGEATPTIAALRAALDLGGLRVTALVREANAHMAAAIVYLNQPGSNNPYHQNGAYHAAKAAALLGQSVIEIDLDDPLDGNFDVRIGQDVTWLS